MRWFAPLAMLPSGLGRNVVFDEVDGRFATVTPDSEPGDATRLTGIVLPGLANCHSHAFHRALRGRTHDRGGSFWTWRETMYETAARLDPDSYYALARGVYAEMALAGITSVGEFHYLHHATGGHRYSDPNAMGAALITAAEEAGVRLTLLDTCYLTGGMSGEPLSDVQLRFSDGDVDGWARRVDGLRDTPTVRHGVAIHSVRAVPRSALGDVAEVAAGRPLHVHVSEQPAENEACLAVYGLTPTELLADEGALGRTTSAVHAVHLEGGDVGLLASSGSTVCICPSTEHDLADGIAPATELRAAGVPLSLGSDQHVVIDMFREAQLLEGDQRARSLRRGQFSPSELAAVMTAHGSLGWDDAGRLEAGARADLVAVRLDTARTVGADPWQVVLAASAADVDTVIVDGIEIVRGGQHRLGDIGEMLIEALP